jgi:hypothetical protein
MSKYIVDDVATGANALNDLLEIICEIQFSLGLEERDPRLNSALWIARDISNGIIDQIEDDNEKRQAVRR